MIAGTLGGFVYFDELEEMDALAKGMFFLGAVISLIGIVILSSRRQPGGGAEGDEKYVCAVSGQDSDMSSGDRSSYEDGSSDEELEGGDVESLEGRAGRDTSLEGDVELSSSVKETLNELGVSPEKNRKKKKKKKKKKSTTKDVGSGFCDEVMKMKPAA